MYLTLGCDIGLESWVRLSLEGLDKQGAGKESMPREDTPMR